LAFLIEALEACGVAPVVQAVLARNFEYYSGTVMRFDVDGLTAGSGGRYDELIGVVGGRVVPASGFALYVTPLSGLLRGPGGTQEKHVVVAPSDNDAPSVAEAQQVASRIRSAGLSASVGDASRAGLRVVCRAGAPRFELTADGATRTFDNIDDLTRALREPHR
jgi:histidyl-tRNA synthetase